ncbi:Uncharacterized protein PECH_007485 [Penicillium ucsense]|uniref:Ferric oxidoreductase domain-containing protein n=1 Tax=Penicillium ucsense TaxID=2839758 RepID=A0A8J8W0Z3_9EURO|nr:Uncharacterized protein PECM_007348 [Penicillium ucsense]KAF7734846.1 Uncharacterized protein PECH_007485 [Penicillium ucsense]
MSWPYQFVTPSEEEKVRRRELLDLRGSYAQYSIILMAIVLRVYQVRAHFAQGEIKDQRRRGQLTWWDRPLFAGWLETRRQYALCGLWLLWLIGLSFWNTGNDYLHLTKALGHVALSQVPLQILMSPAAYVFSSRPASSSMFSMMTSIPQTVLTPYHRLFGRLVISPLLIGHAVLYLLFFAQSSHPVFGSLLNKRVRDFDVQCGLMAVSMLVSVMFFQRPRAASSQTAPRGRLAVRSIRERRQSFYWGHIALVGLLCLAAYFHVAHAHFYMLQALGAFAVNAVVSWGTVRWARHS